MKFDKLLVAVLLGLFLLASITVYISENNYSMLRAGTQLSKTIVYHRANCRHLRRSSYEPNSSHKITLSELKNSGYQTSMCADCTPPLFNPKVWF